MLQPQTYLSFGSIGYNLRDNEIILIQSLLTQEYFETLIPSITNKYIKYNSYDEVEPIITQVYDNTIPSLDHAIGRKNDPICESKINESIASSVWKKCFPDNYSEIEYGKLNSCTFNLIIDLIERKTKKKLQINQVKNELYEEYKKYIEKYIDKITNILILEGKKTLGDQLHAGTLSFSSFIYTDNYFLTPFDLWLLVTKYEIPTIFVCQKYILQTKYEKHQFLAYGDKKDKFAFIVVPGLRPENVPGYKLIQYKESEDDKPKSFIIDGQHRISVVTEYLETKTFEDDILPTKDFQLTVTEIRVGSEADAISYFNKINNVKPIQFEEDPNLIINTYIVGLEKQFPGKLRIKRPYLSADKLREALRPRINSLKKLSVDDFVTKCKIENGKMLEELKRDNKMAERMIQLHFALAWDFKWLDGVLSAQ
jgi:hypothetical protein